MEIAYLILIKEECHNCEQSHLISGKLKKK